MRKEFTMNDKQYEKMVYACQPVPYMIIGGIEPRSQQENANIAWDELGEEMGFFPSTIAFVSKDCRTFTAEEK